VITITSLQVSVADTSLRHGPLGHTVSLNAAVLGALVFTFGAALGMLLLHKSLLRRRSAVSLYFVGAVACAVLAGTTLVAVSSQPSATRGEPLLELLELRGQRVPVLVVPGRPGFNLVGVGARTASAGPDPNRLTAGERRPGSGHTWIGVQLPAGSSRLWVSTGDTGEAVAPVEVDTGDNETTVSTALRGDDGPECASAAAGVLVAGGSRPLGDCPADRLTEPDAAALRSVVAFLDRRGEESVALVGDGSPRGIAAVAEVRAAARRQGITVTEPGTARQPLIVVSGWSGADATVKAVANGKIVAEGTYLAPWLLAPPLLSPSAGQLIPLRYAPRGRAATAYLTALGERLPGELPTAAGYEAWLRERGMPVQASPRLYAAAVLYVPGSGGTAAHHHTAQADWLPSGMIVPVAGPLQEPS
jgi:hypothetical protein